MKFLMILKFIEREKEMQNNLTFCLIKEDDDLLQTEIVGICPFAMARSDIYMTWDRLDELCDVIDNIVSSLEKRKVAWCSGTFGKGFAPAAELKIERSDVRGHFSIELKMELNDGCQELHCCNFCICAETQQLLNFQRSLMRFRKRRIGSEATLTI